jgi:hypothetical protein
MGRNDQNAVLRSKTFQRGQALGRR